MSYEDLRQRAASEVAKQGKHQRTEAFPGCPRRRIRVQQEDPIYSSDRKKHTTLGVTPSPKKKKKSETVILERRLV